jgi:DNA-binding transcriptional regulator YhcF (GntR family)
MSTHESEKPALAIACEYLRAAAAEYREKNVRRMPPLRELARHSGVSLKTMWKAAQECKEEGVITIIHGQGISPFPPSAQKKPIEVPSDEERNEQTGKNQKWHAVAATFRRDILNGRYPPDGSLPKHKELQNRYGVSFKTLSKALKALVGEGTLKIEAGRYRIPPVPVPHQHAKIVLIGHGNEPGRVSLETPRSQQFLRTLEEEITHHNLSLEIVVYNDHHDEPVFLSTRQGATPELPDDEWALGYIVWTVNVLDVPRYVNKIRRSKKPAAFLVEDGSKQIPSSIQSKRGYRSFMLGCTPRAGHDIARFLIRRGHRHVAYISPVHKSQWSAVRYQGLREAFEAAEIPGGVSLFSLSDIEDVYEFQEKFTSGTLNRILDTLHKAILPALPALDLEELEPLRIAIGKFMRNKSLSAPLSHLFDEAVSDPSITAWVTANDFFALLALEYLQSNYIDVPKRISVIGFDDTFDAFLHECTSYNFNIPSLVRAMLRHVLHRNYHPLGKGDEPIELDGMIIERKTTATVKK